MQIGEQTYFGDEIKRMSKGYNIQTARQNDEDIYLKYQENQGKNNSGCKVFLKVTHSIL